VDAITFPDNPGAIVHMAPIAGCRLAIEAGVEPVMHLATRDRTLAAIQSDALAAYALGVRNLFVVSGDDPRRRVVRPYEPVWQGRAPEALKALDELRRSGGPDARRPRPAPLLLGAAADPYEPQARQFSHLAAKARAGADVFVTQLLSDPDTFRVWACDYVDALGPLARPLLVGIGVIRSPKTLEFLNTGVLGGRLSGEWRDHLARAQDPEASAIQRAAATIDAVRTVPLVRGVYLITLGWPDAVPRLMTRLLATPQP
jgi:methylenetetrahydrofolate reductase (NADPH)